MRSITKAAHSRPGASCARFSRIWILQPVLLLAIMAGAALRLIGMIRVDFGYDEIMQARVTLGGFLDSARVARAHFGASPLDYFLCWTSWRIFGTDIALRFPAFMWGILAIPAAWRAGRLLAGRRSAILAAWFVAVCPMLVFSSHLIRWYAALVFFSICAPVAAADFFRRPSLKRALCFWITALLGFLEHPFVGFVLASLMAALFLFHVMPAWMTQPRDRAWRLLRRYFGLAGLLLAAMLPYLFWAAWAGVGKGSPFKPPLLNWNLFREPFLHFCGGSNLYMLLGVVLLAAGVFTLAARRVWKAAFVLLIFLCWPVLIYISIQRSYIFFSRHIIFILPWFQVCLAVGLAAIARQIALLAGKCNRRMVAFILAAAFLLPLINQAPENDWGFGRPMPFRTVRSIVEKNMRPDVWFILPSFLYNPLEWYSRRYERLADRIWETSGPPGGPRGLHFPMRVLWITNNPPGPWILGQGFCYDNIYVFYETYTNAQALGDRLLEFGFQSFVLADAAGMEYLQEQMEVLARRWSVDESKWLSHGKRSHDDFMTSIDLTARAQPLLRQKRFPDARALLEEAFRINPYNVRARAGLAFCALGEEKLNDSITLWYDVLRLCPTFYEAYWNLAQIHRTIGQDELALKAVSRAARFPEASPGVFLFYESLLEKMGRVEEAEAVRIQGLIRERNIWRP
ncbi:MAG TPA: hypothetical protein PLB62_03525 [Candidatus Sumerlaeota bacterium]|nr:hypothetical protein [Candidatus Sumerlaeota bacterium]